MTQSEKYQIEIFRIQGIGYTEIAKRMRISVNSIKTYCRRNALGGKRGYETAGTISICACENCGKPVIQNPKRKRKRFCSDSCRNAFWNSHMDLVKRKAIYEFTCQHCGKQYTSYGNKTRKYCSHQCYVLERFKGGNDE